MSVTYLAHAGGLGWDESLLLLILPIPIILLLVLTARPRPAGADDEEDDDEMALGPPAPDESSIGWDGRIPAESDRVGHDARE
jgi:hypothetical protein